MAQHFKHGLFKKRLKQQRVRRYPAAYFFLPEGELGCHPPTFWLGAAAIVLIFCFLGFLTSRLPLRSPLAMSLSLKVFDTGRMPMSPRRCRLTCPEG
jgi:hypothetical protein